MSISEPTDVELKILRVLWQQPGATARQIHNAVHANQDKNYSTTVKMLSVMLDKGLVHRNDSVRPQTFTAAVTRRKTQKSLVSKLVERAFDGSASSLVMQALSSGKPSKEDLQEIRDLIEKLEQRE
ncbi:BlaI/MecI/CopY family transcriptional regulator [Roseiconus nitratireducens]|uniref:BlaI/MecI/CopY family transcriptional regulator n=1 Tax=Roseiconus nitratireducens TaxID=2605748 RepID=A0A5M6CU63_9BACT|nr:BlaI/MecI/CopY family transcriptional regulator [Roseiconus nitratireducens]KAA5538516.1 BlaI/MecI/CopY family transcriptional regulator [Roseiconus nitratireducens]